jgi:hypothetical protein
MWLKTLYARQIQTFDCQNKTLNPMLGNISSFDRLCQRRPQTLYIIMRI